MWRRICPAASSRPTPNPSTPALLLTVVRFLVPFLTRARIRFSGLPHRPKPPIMMLAPSDISRTASSALATTLFIRGGFYFRSSPERKRNLHHKGHEGTRSKLKIFDCRLTIVILKPLRTQPSLENHKSSPCYAT